MKVYVIILIFLVTILAIGVPVYRHEAQKAEMDDIIKNGHTQLVPLDSHPIKGF